MIKSISVRQYRLLYLLQHKPEPLPPHQLTVQAWVLPDGPALHPDHPTSRELGDRTQPTIYTVPTNYRLQYYQCILSANIQRVVHPPVALPHSSGWMPKPLHYIPEYVTSLGTTKGYVETYCKTRQGPMLTRIASIASKNAYKRELHIQLPPRESCTCII